MAAAAVAGRFPARCRCASSCPRVTAAPTSVAACLLLPRRRTTTTVRMTATGRRRRAAAFRVRAGVGVEIASAVEVINDLGFDTLTFLGVTVLVVPAFRVVKASPILGFFCAGVVLNQFGLIRNLTDVKLLSEWGILFLLFEMGLELSLSRLKALAKFAFGIGLPQVLLSTLAFAAFELPPNGAIGTRILQFLFNSRPDLVNIRSVDEAIVIGAALSLSSSAFVLQLLAEKGELATRFGSATLGILLLQDIAVVPLLVILPVLESQNVVEQSVWPMLLAESLKALGGLGILSLGGKYLIRRIFCCRVEELRSICCPLSSHRFRNLTSHSVVGL
ncbi:K(+) efflux antiporter 3, chloroplastic [Hordeum vulgare]|nr:K(+) efflux antiporter 3, chloroplastic [Hordeum vulgare]